MAHLAEVAQLQILEVRLGGQMVVSVNTSVRASPYVDQTGHLVVGKLAGAS